MAKITKVYIFASDYFKQATIMIDQSIFDAEYYVIDIFPSQIPAERGAAYSEAEKFFRQEPHLTLLRQKFARLAIKLGCYSDITLEYNDLQLSTPVPSMIYDTIINCKPIDSIALHFTNDNCAITYNGDDLYMTFYNPEDNLLKLAEKICGAEGLFLRK